MIRIKTYINWFWKLNREKARFQADEVQIALDESKSRYEQIQEQFGESKKQISALTETNQQLMKQNEMEKIEAMESLDELKKVVEEKQGQLIVLLEETKQRDSVVGELNKQMQQLQSEFATQRTKLEEQLQKTLEEAKVMGELQKELYVLTSILCLLTF